MTNPQLIYSVVRNKSFPCKTRSKTRKFILTYHFLQHSTEHPGRAVRQEEEIRGIQIRNDEIILSLSADDMILYIANLKDSTKKLLETKTNTIK